MLALLAAASSLPAQAKSGDARGCVSQNGALLYNRCGAAVTLFYCYYSAGAVNEGYRCPRFNRVTVPNGGSQYMTLPVTGAYAQPQPRWGGCILPAQTQFFNVGAGGITYTCSPLPDDTTSRDELSEMCKFLLNDPDPAPSTINRCRSAGYDVSKFDRPPVVPTSPPPPPPTPTPSQPIPKPPIPSPSVPPELQEGADATNCTDRPQVSLGYDGKTCVGMHNHCAATIHVLGCWDGPHEDDGFKCPRTGAFMLKEGQTTVTCTFGARYPGTRSFWGACYDPFYPHDSLYVPERGLAFNCTRN